MERQGYLVIIFGHVFYFYAMRVFESWKIKLSHYVWMQAGVTMDSRFLRYKMIVLHSLVWSDELWCSQPGFTAYSSHTLVLVTALFWGNRMVAAQDLIYHVSPSHFDLISNFILWWSHNSPGTAYYVIFRASVAWCCYCCLLSQLWLIRLFLVNVFITQKDNSHSSSIQWSLVCDH